VRVLQGPLQDQRVARCPTSARAGARIAAAARRAAAGRAREECDRGDLSADQTVRPIWSQSENE